MSYTPYTWQSGDTVTASRLNNIEQGVQDMNSNYTPTTWVSGDIVTAAKLNNIEQGIANGGGGSSDFSTATVTINATPPTGVTISDVYITPSFEFPEENAHYSIEMMTYTSPVGIVLYKGEGYLNDVTAEDSNFNPYTLDNPTLSGGITRDVENNRYVITGDCSISGTLSQPIF